jgi:kynurenine formamidase
VEDETLVDLSHLIEPGMTTYKGLPGPAICDFWSRADSAAFYDDGETFQIGRIDMVANTGTYLDTPFHRLEDGADLAGIALDQVAALDGMVIRKPHAGGLAIDAGDLGGIDVRGKAVLFHTGWDEHWRSLAYFENHPFLTAAAAEALARGGAALVGIDSYNIDDTRTRTRPVHTILLGAGVLICEHLTNLRALPESRFRFSAVPPKFSGVGTFPVRAFAEVATAFRP